MGGPSLWDKIEHRTRVPVHVMNADFDVVSGALIMIDYPHHEVHEGNFFETSVYDAAIINNGTLIIAATIPAATYCHFAYDAALGGDALVELLEGATLAGGTPVPLRNANRNVVDPPFGALKNPTLGGSPIAIPAGGFLIPGGKGPNAGGASGGSREGVEIITRPSTTYAIRMTNISGNTKPGSIAVGLYIKSVATG